MVRVATKTARIEGPDLLADDDGPSEIDLHNRVVVEQFSWDFIEETINDLLPDGYYCKIED